MDFIVLCSSRGTTFQAVIDAMKARTLTARCLGLITDKPDRQCIAKAEAATIPVSIVERKKGMTREEFEKEIDQAIVSLGGQSTVILAAMGWMWILTPWFINRHRGRILNVHPALLPQHGGEGFYGDHVHDAVLASGAKESGVSIHVMDDGVDTGPILLQKTCPIVAGETVDSLKEKVQALEREWYPKTLQMLESGLLKLPST
ncbi:MAG TPA: phosphoribosylglycinamide formyltransferase [Candidatus Peribacteraceae bacterium]|nr:phosphoribosylglycinamide formyltransferase [Candidatus Peribacteraceae bacterium]